MLKKVTESNFFKNVSLKIEQYMLQFFLQLIYDTKTKTDIL